jgi:hypothetical protein
MYNISSVEVYKSSQACKTCSPLSFSNSVIVSNQAFCMKWTKIIFT